MSEDTCSQKGRPLRTSLKFEDARIATFREHLVVTSTTLQFKYAIRISARISPGGKINQMSFTQGIPNLLYVPS